MTLFASSTDEAAATLAPWLSRTRATDRWMITSSSTIKRWVSARFATVWHNSSSRIVSIARAVDGPDDTWSFRIDLDLLAKLGDVLIERPAVGIDRAIPAIVKKTISIENDPGILGER